MSHVMNPDVAKEIARRSGLKESTVHELLEAGYSYTEQLARPIVWVRDALLTKEEVNYHVNHTSQRSVSGGLQPSLRDYQIDRALRNRLDEGDV